MEKNTRKTSRPPTRWGTVWLQVSAAKVLHGVTEQKAGQSVDEQRKTIIERSADDIINVQGWLLGSATTSYNVLGIEVNVASTNSHIAVGDRTTSVQVVHASWDTVTSSD